MYRLRTPASIDAAPAREPIALAVAQLNDCACCLSAHGDMGKRLAKPSEAEIQKVRLTDAIQRFRSDGNENRAFDGEGWMHARIASTKDLRIAQPGRLVPWPAGRRPDDHAVPTAPGL